MPLPIEETVHLGFIDKLEESPGKHYLEDIGEVNEWNRFTNERKTKILFDLNIFKYKLSLSYFLLTFLIFKFHFFFSIKSLYIASSA